MHVNFRVGRPPAVDAQAHPTARERVRAAWQRHPALALGRHRRRITLLRQLHSLVKAGFGLPSAFAELSASGSDADTALAMRNVSTRIADGAGFSE